MDRAAVPHSLAEEECQALNYATADQTAMPMDGPRTRAPSGAAYALGAGTVCSRPPGVKSSVGLGHETGNREEVVNVAAKR